MIIAPTTTKLYNFNNKCCTINNVSYSIRDDAHRSYAYHDGESLMQGRSLSTEEYAGNPTMDLSFSLSLLYC